MPGSVYGENEESLDLARIGLWFVSILLSLSTIALLCSCYVVGYSFTAMQMLLLRLTPPHLKGWMIQRFETA